MVVIILVINVAIIVNVINVNVIIIVIGIVIILNVNVILSVYVLVHGVYVPPPFFKNVINEHDFRFNLVF